MTILESNSLRKSARAAAAKPEYSAIAGRSVTEAETATVGSGFLRIPDNEKTTSPRIRAEIILKAKTAVKNPESVIPPSISENASDEIAGASGCMRAYLEPDMTSFAPSLSDLSRNTEAPAAASFAAKVGPLPRAEACITADTGF